MNALKVAKLFKDYLASKAPPPPPVAAVGRGAAPADELPPGDAIETQPPSPAEIKEFYKRSALGKVTDQQRASFEARLKLRTLR
jgi:hypothetical protein